MSYKNRKRRENNYGNVQKRAARKGIVGLVMAIVEILLLVLILASSAANGGDLKPIIGALTFILFGFGGLGLWISLQSFHEIDKNYSVSRIAVGANALLMFAIFVIFVLGLR